MPHREYVLRPQPVAILRMLVEMLLEVRQDALGATPSANDPVISRQALRRGVGVEAGSSACSAFRIAMSAIRPSGRWHGQEFPEPRDCDVRDIVGPRAE